MARYITSVPTAWSAADAFDYMADVRNFAHWDPGVTDVRIVADATPAAYDVDVKAGLGTTTLRYVVEECDRPRRVLLRAETATMCSVDEVRVEETAAGTVVTYDAELTLRGLLRFADPLLRLAFGRIGDRAAAGLRAALGAPQPPHRDAGP